MDRLSFTMPAKINAGQLQTELGCESLFSDNGQLVIMTTLTQDQAQVIITAHVPQPTAEELQAQTDATMKASIGAKMSALTYTPLVVAEVAWIGKAIS